MIYSGWSEYKRGDVADLRQGANLIKSGHARKGWGEYNPPLNEPTHEQYPYIVSNADANATPSAKKLADKHNLMLYSVKGTGKGGKITLNDVKALVTE